MVHLTPEARAWLCPPPPRGRLVYQRPEVGLRIDVDLDALNAWPAPSRRAAITGLSLLIAASVGAGPAPRGGA